MNSPVDYVATATTATCAKGVSSMGIYVNNKIVYIVNAPQLNTLVNLAPGAEHTVVEEWDYCGGAAYTTINLTVQGSTTVNMAAEPGFHYVWRLIHPDGGRDERFPGDDFGHGWQHVHSAGEWWNAGR